MKTLPEYDLLSAFYLGKRFDASTIRMMTGGDVDDPQLENTCIIRLSRPLNYLGQPIPKWTKKFRTRQGSDKYWYGLRVKEFWTYMTETYGPPTVFAKKPIDPDMFRAYPGIIGFRVSGWNDASGHFTLWDGSSLAYAGDPPHPYFQIADEAALWQAGNETIAPY